MLPDGITPVQVSYLAGPAGWSLTPGDSRCTVAGPALQQGTNAEYKVKLATLPATATSPAFKTLVTYTDGQVDRWIEIRTPARQEPPDPAPVLSLQPAAATAVSTSAPAALASQPASASTTPASAATADDRSSPVGWITAGVLVVLAATGVALSCGRRRSRAGLGTWPPVAASWPWPPRHRCHDPGGDARPSQPSPGT